jgi:ABC-type sugar transport system substrate-binding protein
MPANADFEGRDSRNAEDPPATLDRRRFLHTGAAGVVGLAASGLLAACGSNDSSQSTGAEAKGGASARDVTFGFSHPYAEVPVVATVKGIIKRIAEKDGWKVLLDETQAGNLQNQLATLDTWITQKITAMSVTVLDPSTYETTAKRALDAGVIWTTYGGKMTNAAGGVLFPPDLSGTVTGKAAVEWINANDPNAEVLVLELPSGGPQRQRTDIPKRMIASQTKAKVVATQGAIEQSKGLQVTQDVLQSHPNVTVVIGHNDDGALGAAEAFRQAGKVDRSKVWIIGQDGSKDALTALKNGNSYFKASAALDVGRLCAEVVNVTKRAIERRWKPGDPQEWISVGPKLVSVGDTKEINTLLRVYQ